MNIADIRQLFDYTEWANARVLEAAANLSDEDMRRDFAISYKSIFGTLLHMAGAEWIWLERWHGRSPAKEDAWPRWTPGSCPDLDALKLRWADLIESRDRYVAELDEARFDAELPFKLLSGDASSLRLAHQMQHVVNHASYHRGQITTMLRQLGAQPPKPLDMIAYYRVKEAAARG